MATIVTSGTARNLGSVVTRDGRELDPTERRFLTFLTDTGAVHTIVVDLDHAAHDADTLLRWFEQTRAGVELSSSVPGSPHHLTPEQVIARADRILGLVSQGGGLNG